MDQAHYPVSNKFYKQLKLLRKETINCNQAIRVLSKNRQYQKRFNLLLDAMFEDPFLFKQFYLGNVKFDIINTEEK